MNWGVWITIVIFVILIVILALLALFLRPQPSSSNQPSNAQIEEFLTQTRPTPQWGKRTASSTPQRNTCQVYEFPAVMDGPYALLGQPTFNTTTINGLPPLGPPTGCTDIDEMALQQFTETCLQEQCTDASGTVYQQGEQRTFYGLCGTGNSVCNDVLGTISIGFEPVPPPPQPVAPAAPLCMSLTNQLPATAASCSLADPNQLLQVVRYNPDGQTVNNSSGPYARIVHRQTGLCVAPSGTSAANPVTTINTPLVLVDCSQLPNNGIIWWLFPGAEAIELSSDNDQSIVRRNIPPQLVFWTAIIQTPPASNRQLIQFLAQNQNRLFAVREDGLGQQLTMELFNVNDQDKSYNAQLLSYATYNLLLTSELIAKHW